jgi:hypothetical protein
MGGLATFAVKAAIISNRKYIPPGFGGRDRRCRVARTGTPAFSSSYDGHTAAAMDA